MVEKRVWPIYSQDSKIDYLKNEQMELTYFLRIDKVSQKSKADQKFIEWACSKKGVASLVTGL